MTGNLDGRVALADAVTMSPAMAADVDAAGLAVDVVSLLDRAMEQSGLRAKDIAERLGITEGRVSQVLNGDGNIRVATLGKFLSAMGFQPSVAATSRDKGVVIEGRPSRLGPSRDHDAGTFSRPQRVSRRILTPHL